MYGYLMWNVLHINRRRQIQLHRVSLPDLITVECRTVSHVDVEDP